MKINHQYKRFIVSARNWAENNENVLVNILTTISGIGVFAMGLFLIGIINE